MGCSLGVCKIEILEKNVVDEDLACEVSEESLIVLQRFYWVSLYNIVNYESMISCQMILENHLWLTRYEHP